MSQVNSVEKDCFMWRAYIAQQKYRVVLDSIKSSDNDVGVLRAIEKVAEYFAQPNSRSSVVTYFDGKFSQYFEDDYKGIWSILAGTVYYNEGLYENALKYCFIIIVLCV